MQSKAAHHVIPFLNFSWDHRKIEFSYTHDQIVSSPLGMRSYKVISILSPTFGTDLFLNHKQIPISNQPCFTGSRVAVYHTAIWVGWHILSIRDSMQHGYNISINTNKFPKYEGYVQNSSACDFFKSVIQFQFQQTVVGDWNKT